MPFKFNPFSGTLDVVESVPSFLFDADANTLTVTLSDGTSYFWEVAAATRVFEFEDGNLAVTEAGDTLILEVQ